MKYPLIAAIAALSFVSPAFADGDVAKGEKEFGKCKSCHMVVAPDGTEIVKGGKTGPNLYGVMGRVAGSADFKFGQSIKDAGAKGLVWDAENFEDYVQDPAKFLSEYLSKADGKEVKAKSSMTFKLKKGGEDIAAWLTSVAPAN